MRFLLDQFEKSKVRLEAEAKSYGRWPVGKEHYTTLEIPKYLKPISQHTVQEYVWYMTLCINKLADRSPEVLDYEAKPYFAPHLCKGNPEAKCPACEGKVIERHLIKLAIDDRSGAEVLGPAKAKTYKRKRWQTEHKAKLIQKKWNKMAAKKMTLQPRRWIEYYSFSKVQFRIFQDMYRKL